MPVTFEQFGLVVKEILDYDKNLIGDTTFYVLLTRKEESNEVYGKDGALSFQKIKLTFTGEVISEKSLISNQGVSKLHFSAYVNPLKGEVSLTGGDVMIQDSSLRGHRIGTYIMNEIVSWSKKWPDTLVKSIRVSPVDAKTDETRYRRNRFYEQFGIPFQYTSVEKRQGSSIPIKTKKLSNISTWKSNIEVLNATDFLTMLINQKKHAQQSLETETQRSKYLLQRLDVIEQNPVRYAIKTLFWRNLSKIMQVGILISVSFLIYIEIQ
ncbi:hypothetical protein NBRC116188_19690 [Oceaniserpentilla sp. 4NH20-0058]|uniref:hypothetical protein n=1 Tax=Oceaniserpentilla sp. 4NH20-0058 TaxID=3127660 RepID=UPI00310B9414